MPFAGMQNIRSEPENTIRLPFTDLRCRLHGPHAERDERTRRAGGVCGKGYSLPNGKSDESDLGFVGNAGESQCTFEGQSRRMVLRRGVLRGKGALRGWL